MHRFLKVYLDDVSECQGELFIVAQGNGFDVKEFINYYMKSTIRSYIDNGAPYYCNLLGKEVYEVLLKTEGIKVKKSTTRYNKSKLQWIGEFYSLCQWYSNLSSSMILDKIPVDFVFSRYNTLHDMDITLAVKKVLLANNLGFYEEGQLQDDYIYRYQ